MREVALFVEDIGHEEFLKAMVKKFSALYNVPVKVVPRSVRGGHGRATTELKQYLRDLQRQQKPIPDLVIVARDANCQGIADRERELKEISEKFERIQDLVVYAIPDPHIERWLLLDSAAFKSVLGKGCAAPDHKCDRDRYKILLLNAIREAEVEPLLGGMEYAEDLVNAMDVQRMKTQDQSLGKLLQELGNQFKLWSCATNG